ncbi:MAG: hypothetical protein ACTSR3_05585 [Candidatus Helarchaeota archaeon]
MKIVNLQRSREKYSFIEDFDEVTVSSIFNTDEAKRFINFIEKYKQENELERVYIRIPGIWHSDTESRKLLFEYLRNTRDYVIIETSPVLRAYFKTELTISQCDPKRIIKERR